MHLALQGGGAHGAFTWGVLDALLMDGRLDFAGISGTSAGALNAVALAHGWAQGLDHEAEPMEEARAALARIWTKVMEMGALNENTARLSKLMMGALPAAWTRLSPYQSNPLDINPLRDLIAEQTDFARLQKLDQPRVFVAATDVATGLAEIFSGARLTVEAVMASACLPHYFQAPEIDGKLYWDGGYAANPAMGPLLEMGVTQDILLVQINPLHRSGQPLSAAAIADRINDLTFNASLIAQMRTISIINELVAQGIDGVNAGESIHLHRIDGGQELEQMPAETKVRPTPATLLTLFELGQRQARNWLEQDLDKVGRISSVAIHPDYGQPLNFNLEQLKSSAHTRASLAGYFRALLGGGSRK